MNRRRFFQIAAGVLGALALPVPKRLTEWYSPWYYTYRIPFDFMPIRTVRWSRNAMVGIFPKARFIPTGEAFKTKSGVICVPGEFKSDG